MTLLERLRGSVIDERELDPVLRLAAGGEARIIGDGEIEYLTAGPNGQVFAWVTFKHGRIINIKPGPPLQSKQAQDALVERARRETIHSHGTAVVSRVLFAERQLKGVYLWNDSVRLSPCPSTARIGKGLDWFDHGLPSNSGSEDFGPPFPFLLEVRIQRSPNPFLEANRILRQLDVYQFLFTLLLVGHIRFVHLPSGRLWTILKQGGLPENHLIHLGFFTNEEAQYNDFPVRKFGPAPVFEGGDYYNRPWINDSQLFVPASLEADLQLFNSLPRDIANTFMRACYWYALGIQFRSEPSLATVAFSAAIECLLPPQNSSFCEKCGKPIGPGPTKFFNLHVERYGTVDSALHLLRKSLYDARSALVHGRHASRVDIDFMSTNRNSYYDNLLLLEIISQRSLINWLRDPERTTWHLSKGLVNECTG